MYMQLSTGSSRCLQQLFNYTLCSCHLALTIAYADWKAMYQPSAEQAEKDRMAAYEAGVPHGEFSRLIMSLRVAVAHDTKVL